MIRREGQAPLPSLGPKVPAAKSLVETSGRPPMRPLKPRQPPVPPVVRANGDGGRIRIVIVENHQLVSDSLALLLDTQANMEVVATARSVAEATAMPKLLAPDVAVLDFHLDDGTGRDAAVQLRDLFPNVRFVFLSRDGSDDARLAAIEVGASAYLLKSGPASEVIDAVRRVAAGQTLITPRTIATLVSNGRDRAHVRGSLSPRELEVLQLLADGVATRVIGQRLGISYSTVRTHVRSISVKLGTSTMVNAVLTARELELVS
jgi:DNA-binding NarL/FixJ family response regulator